MPPWPTAAPFFASAKRTAVSVTLTGVPPTVDSPSVLLQVQAGMRFTLVAYGTADDLRFVGGEDSVAALGAGNVRYQMLNATVGADSIATFDRIFVRRLRKLGIATYWS